MRPHGRYQDVGSQAASSCLTDIFKGQSASMHQLFEKHWKHVQQELTLGHEQQMALLMEHVESSQLLAQELRDLRGEKLYSSSEYGSTEELSPESRRCVKSAWGGAPDAGEARRRSNFKGSALSTPASTLAVVPPNPKHLQNVEIPFDPVISEHSPSENGAIRTPDERENSFIDHEKLKSAVRASLVKRSFKVSDFYKENGFCQRLARSTMFEQFTLAVVTINALWIAIDTDFNKAEFILDASSIFLVAENTFCVIFFFEWFVRFNALARKVSILKDHWFLFDTVLVYTMILETWVMPVIVVVFLDHSNSGGGVGNASVLRIARLLRLSRMARVARVLRAMPELVILIKALKAATRSVFFTLFLLVLVLYVFGIAFAQLTSGTEVGDDLFPTVATAMYTLLLYGVLCLDFLDGISSRLNSVNAALPILLFMFVLLASLTIMNMLIGVLCEVVSAVAKIEKESLLVGYAKGKVERVVEELDTDGDRQISKTEFMRILGNPTAIKALHDVGVDVVGLIDFADTIFWDGSVQDEIQLSFEKFMDVVLNLRNSNVATVKDILNLGRMVRANVDRIDAHLEDIRGARRSETGCTGCVTHSASSDTASSTTPTYPYHPSLSPVFLAAHDIDQRFSS